VRCSATCRWRRSFSSSPWRASSTLGSPKRIRR
jgi:hypothetical protein